MYAWLTIWLLQTALACGGEKNGVRLLGKKTIELMATNHLGQEQLRRIFATTSHNVQAMDMGSVYAP